MRIAVRFRSKRNVFLLHCNTAECFFVYWFVVCLHGELGTENWVFVWG